MRRALTSFLFYRMPPVAPLAGLLLAGLLFIPSLTHAQSLPANPPTSLANPNTPSPPLAATPAGGNQGEHHKARVSYANGLLEVRADNSSLNQILRDISRETGMSIVGGVADQRVFGNYGPAAASTVLQTLLDGTNTNMLLKETSTGGPAQLILTPRSGGAAFPGPNSASYNETEAEPELGQPQPTPSKTVSPTAYSTTAAFTNQPPTSAEPENPPPGNTSTTPVKTPEQIFQELQQIQQKKQPAQQSPPSQMPPGQGTSTHRPTPSTQGGLTPPQ
jgi:hypothetical protein